MANCKGKGCLLARHCQYYADGNLYDDEDFDHCDEEFRLGYVSKRVF